MISVHQYGSSITRFVVTEMNHRQPPRYFITNRSLVNLVLFENEESQKFMILPGDSIHFESESENNHFPSTARCPTVKLFVQTGEETGHFFLHPGEQGARTQNSKLFVKIEELGKRRIISILSPDEICKNTGNMRQMELSMNIKGSWTHVFKKWQIKNFKISSQRYLSSSEFWGPNTAIAYMLLGAVFEISVFWLQGQAD